MRPIRSMLVGCCVIVGAGCGARTAEVRTAVSIAEALVPASAPTDQVPANPMDAWFKGNVSYARRANEEEQRVAACMKQAGLQWVPRVVPESEPEARGALREYRKTMGYGINTATNNVTHENDPNLAIMKGLGEADLDRYLTFLEGPYGDNGRHGGCRETSAIPDAAMAKRSANPRATQLWDAMQSAPEVAQGLRDWSLCMASSGFPNLTGPEDARMLAGGSSSAALELSIASADVRCAEAHLWEPWRKYGEPAVQELGPA